jgi:DNA-binding NarL/FixJ family response regulator
VQVSVLVVDDDVRFRGLAARMLVSLDMAVVGEVGTVSAAAQAAVELRPDAVLVDVGLPDGNGLALARQLAALPWRPRIVIVSSDRDATTPEDARSLGAVGFIPKDDLPDASLDRLLAGGQDLEYG